jgi:diguanylate cyclase (GGDEF)-like protein
VTAPPSPTNELVPLAERHFYMQIYRVAVVVTLGMIYAAWPDQFDLKWTTFAIISASYLVLSFATHRTWHLRRSYAITVFGFGLMVDGLYLAATTYGSSGIGTPLTYLVLAGLVTTTLLGSFRTGVKMAVWNVLLLASVFELEKGKVLRPHRFPAAQLTWATMAISAGVIVSVTIATASFAAVNERELRRRNFDLHALSRLAWKLEASLTPANVGRELIACLRENFGVSRALVVARHNGRLELIAGAGTARPAPGTAPELDQFVQEMLVKQETSLVKKLDPKAEPWLTSVLPDAVNILAAPLYAKGGVVGLLVAEHGARPGSRVEQRVVTIIERCVSYAALALAGAWLLDASLTSAATDPLTGVGNRRMFDQRLEHELAMATTDGGLLACMMIDLDRFKEINDRYGHTAGDEVLQAVAGEIASRCRPSDIVARFGGEEFVVLVQGLGLDTVMEIAERIRASVAALQKAIPASVSIGVAAFPYPIPDPAKLVEMADRALYEAKRSGRNRVALATNQSSLPDEETAEVADNPGGPNPNSPAVAG